nr:MAG TPA: hypothetical protein [Caudoviricetes sp.]
MKSLISVTPREFKRHFGEVMDMCTDMCMTTNQEIVIIIPEKKNGQTHAEIAKVIPVDGGYKYEYNHELLKKFGINIQNPKLPKIAAIMADAFEQEKVYTIVSPEAEHRLARAMETAAKELVKTFGL